MEIKIKPNGERVFVFSENESYAKDTFDGALMVGNTQLEDLIKAAISAHAELQKQEALAWDTVIDLIKEISPVEDGAEFEYNGISGEFKIVKKEEGK